MPLEFTSCCIGLNMSGEGGSEDNCQVSGFSKSDAGWWVTAIALESEMLEFKSKPLLIGNVALDMFLTLSKLQCFHLQYTDSI